MPCGVAFCPMEWWQRLDQIIRKNGLSVKDVAAKARVNEKSLYGWLKGGVDKPRGDVVERLAHAVGTTEQALHYGPADNAAPIRRVPLIEMTKLGVLKATDDPISIWDGVTTIEVPRTVPDGSFAVTLPDDSAAPEFRKNDVVICDPKAPIEPGCYVVIVKSDEHVAYFGKFKPAVHGDLKRFTLVRDGQFFPDIEIKDRRRGFVLARAVKHIRDI